MVAVQLLASLALLVITLPSEIDAQMSHNYASVLGLSYR